MKAVVKTKLGYGNVELLEVEEPVCKSDSVKIEIKFAGICGTDQHIYHDTYKSNPPVIIGHEFSGVVHEIVLRETNGRGVDAAVECAGAGPSISSCLRGLKKRGKYLQVGITGKEVTLDFDTILYSFSQDRTIARMR